MIVCGGCSTDSISANPDPDWELKEEVLDSEAEPQPESEPEPEPEPVRIPVQTDGSEPEDLEFVFHSIEEATQTPDWDDDYEFRSDIAHRGRWITQTIRKPSDPSERRDGVWLGTKMPSFQSEHGSEKIHVFECIPELTMWDYHYELNGSTVFCNSKIIQFNIRASNAQGTQWFDTVSNLLLESLVNDQLETFLQEGTLPAWEGVWFQADESRNLSFQGHAVSNKNYTPYLSSDHPLVELRIETIVE